MKPSGSDVDWQRLNEIFARALEREGDTAQVEYIRSACNGDAELSAAGEALIRANRSARASGFLSADGFRAGARAIADAEANARPLPQVIGDYRIVRELGRGGMGTVFLAERVTFKQRVALKVIKRGMDTDEIVRRFHREREVLAGLEHPNIARLLDGGTTQDGLPFFVMEYVEGQPITTFCDENKLSIHERLQLFVRLCAAVAHIHSRSIVHRDIKPSNAVINHVGEPKLLDFGIAKLLAPTADMGACTLTGDEPRLFTPEYASPEQLRGERASTASDVYSLGVLLYELLSGHRPFRSETGSPLEVMKMLEQREATAPSTAIATTHATPPSDAVAQSRSVTLNALRRDLRGDLDLITLKALRKQPAERYSSVEAFCDDLQRHLSGRPVAARPASTADRAVKFVRRNRTTVGASGVCALVLALAGATVAYFADRPLSPTPMLAPVGPPPRSIAVLPFKNLTGTAERELLADGLTESLTASLAKVDGLKVISRHSASAFRGREIGPDEIGRQLNVASVLEGSVRESNGKIRVELRLVNAQSGEIIWSGDHSRPANDLFRMQDELARSTVAQLRFKLSAASQERLTTRHTNSLEAYHAYTKGRYFWKKKDLESLEKARRFFEEAIRLDPDYALAYNGLANYYASSIWYGDISVIEAVEKTKAAVRKLVEIAPDSAEAHDGLARVAWFDWDWETYRREAEKAVELAPNDAGIWQNYCFMLLGVTGRVDDAIAALRHAYELDPLSPSIGADLGMLLSGAGRSEEAFAVFEKTIETDPNFPGVYANLRSAYERAGMHREAFDALLKLHTVGGTNPTHVEELRVAYETGGLNGLRRKELEQMLTHPEKGMNAFSIATAYLALGEKEPALAWLEKAYAMRHPTLVSLNSAGLDALRDDPRFQDLLRRVGFRD